MSYDEIDVPPERENVLRVFIFLCGCVIGIAVMLLALWATQATTCHDENLPGYSGPHHVYCDGAIVKEDP